MALLAALARLRGGPMVSALTVDHGLRPGSRDEALQVSQWAREMGVPHVTLVWKGTKPSTGIQAAAREARYGLMAAWCRAHGASWLLTAHTLDDQAETVLMRLMRTSSIESLAGIARHGEWDGVRLSRPFLGVKRSELRRFLTGLDQAWIDDPSNDDDRFERVRMRRLMPMLAAAGVDADRLATLAAQCSLVSAAISRSASLWLKTCFWQSSSGCGVFSAEDLAKIPMPVRIAVLRQLVDAYGKGRPPDRAEIERLAGWVIGRGNGRTLGGAVFRRVKGTVQVCREQGRAVRASEATLTTYLP